MGLLQVGDVESGVVVQGLEGAVAEQLLDMVEVGVALDHLRPPRGQTLNVRFTADGAVVCPDAFQFSPRRYVRPRPICGVGAVYATGYIPPRRLAPARGVKVRNREWTPMAAKRKVIGGRW